MKTRTIKNTLRVSFLDGIFASIMTGFSETFMTPYCLALGGTTRQVGLLASIPNLAASLSQLKSSDLINRLKGRKAILTICVFLHALMWLPIIAVPYIFKQNPAMYLITFAVLFATFNGFSLPAWLSMMSDYIPARSRGRYFGFRNRVLGLVVVVSSFTAGFILKNKAALAGFAIIFSVAFLSRMISWFFLTKMRELPLKISAEAYFSFWDFVKRIRQSNFAKFVFFVGSMSFAVNLASPFFAVYMLKDLRMDYMRYTIVVTSATLTSLVMMEIWGRHADIAGNVKVLKTTALVIPLIPILWLFSSNVIYLIVVQMAAGFLWAGFNLSASNFIYDAVSPPKRPRCIAYFNVINGAAIYLGAFLGGFLATAVPAIRGNRLLCLFLLSGIARMLVTAVFYNRIKEVKRI